MHLQLQVEIFKWTSEDVVLFVSRNVRQDFNVIADGFHLPSFSLPILKIRNVRYVYSAILNVDKGLDVFHPKESFATFFSRRRVLRFFLWIRVRTPYLNFRQYEL